MTDPSPVKHLWMHPHPTSTRTHEFKTRIERNFNQNFPAYEDLRQWSISNTNRFWEQVWQFTGIRASEPFIEVNIHVKNVGDPVMSLTDLVRPLTKMLLCFPALPFSKVLA